MSEELTVEQKLEAATKQNAELQTKLEALQKAKAEPEEKPEPKSLREKAKEERQSAEDRAKETKDIESALKFNLHLDGFVKKNEDLLPKEILHIIELANKETYESAKAKANAIMSNIVQTYFSVQDNRDALTQSQKDTLDDYLKLTKNGKEDKANEIYVNLFEPALETFRKVKKAEELALARSGFVRPSDEDEAYKQRLIKQRQSTYKSSEKGV